jgi:LmbE family N-acetylglucosaminyl deacetylase
MLLLLVLAGAASHFWANLYLYDYDVEADYNYDFAPDSNTLNRINVKVYKDHFLLPKTSGDWDTGLLRINVSSSFLGKFFSPYVEVACEGKHYKQYFEHGARGVRYINFSHIANTNSTRVTITGHHLSWDVQENELLLFNNPRIADKKILVIAPHPDDAEVAAFGLYSYKNSRIVSITDGSTGSAKYEKYFFSDDKNTSYGLIAKLRVIDSLTVPAIGGVGQQNCSNLAYYSETLEEMCAYPDKDVKNRHTTVADDMSLRKLNITQLPYNARPNWLSLVNDITHVLNVFQPDIIVTPHPLLDTNLDHQHSTLALFEAIKKTNLSRKGKFYFYSNHYILGRGYQYGDQGSLTTLPPHFSKLGFSSIYSHELTKRIQMEKLFALDSMHDLRPLPYKVNISFLDYLSNTAHVLIEYLRNGSEFDLSYYRKSIKSNELFFVYPFSDASEIYSAYESQHAHKKIAMNRVSR